MNEQLFERLLTKVEINPEGCWPWIGAPTAAGYGRLKVEGRPKLAHRLMYELLVEPIPSGLQLDHLCRNRLCLNPDHLEPVTNRENWLRGECPSAVTYRTNVCQRGHSMKDAITNTGGYRTCRTCHRENQRRRRQERRQTP